MPELRIRSDRSVLVVITDTYLEPSAELVQALSRDLDALDSAVHLNFLRAVKLTENPLEYLYKFKALDGRRFDQSLLFQDGVRQTFDTHGDRWLENEEFVHHRPIRAAVVTLIRDYRLVSLEARYGDA